MKYYTPMKKNKQTKITSLLCKGDVCSSNSYYSFTTVKKKENK